MSRKTFTVDNFKNFINASLLQTSDDLVEYRQGLIDALENVLHGSDNYNGFVYLTDQEMEKTLNNIPGVRYIDETEEFSFVDIDRTRVKYF